MLEIIKQKPFVIDITQQDNEFIILAKRETIKECCLFLRDECEFQMLMDICGVDYPEKEERFEIVYHLVSITKNLRARIKIITDEDTPVNSIVPIYSSANWLERETYDMFGVEFEGHPNLERILTDYNFEGFPLRKDFPLEGFKEVVYSEEEGRIVYKKL